jgi:hypothetical protein
MKRPFAFVVYVEHYGDEPWVSLYRTLDEAEAALRDLAAANVVQRPRDDEIVETLAECGERVRVFACTTELEPFTRTAKAA